MTNSRCYHHHHQQQQQRNIIFYCDHLFFILSFVLKCNRDRYAFLGIVHLLRKEGWGAIHLVECYYQSIEDFPPTKFRYENVPWPPLI